MLRAMVLRSRDLDRFELPPHFAKCENLQVDESFAEKWEIWYPMRFNFYEERQHRNDS
jgi:hypothetical protein